MPPWMPGAGFRRLASKLAHNVENELVKKPYEIARQNLVSYARSSMAHIHFADEKMTS
jgi:hypothetical protein